LQKSALSRDTRELGKLGAQLVGKWRIWRTADAHDSGSLSLTFKRE
jgi:hypothetical protein